MLTLKQCLTDSGSIAYTAADFDEEATMHNPFSTYRYYDGEYAGQWLVAAHVARVFGGRKLNLLTARAVVDDFGDIVLVEPLQ
jgi:hypothetical protein